MLAPAVSRARRVGKRGQSLRAAEVDLPGEDLEVLGVVGQQWNPMHVGGRRYRQIECPSPGLAAAPCDECV